MNLWNDWAGLTTSKLDQPWSAPLSLQTLSREWGGEITLLLWWQRYHIVGRLKRALAPTVDCLRHVAVILSSVSLCLQKQCCWGLFLPAKSRQQIHSRPAWLRPLSIDDPIAYQFSEGLKSCRSMYSVLTMHHNMTYSNTHTCLDGFGMDDDGCIMMYLCIRSTSWVSSCFTIWPKYI